MRCGRIISTSSARVLCRFLKMTNQEIVEELKQLSNAERLAVIEEASRLIRQELSQPVKDQRKQRLAAAAEALLRDYSSDGELTAFSSLDSEEFHCA